MNGFQLRHAALTLVVAVFSFGGSCVSDSGGTYNGSGSGSSSGNGGYNNGGYGPDRYNDRDADRPHRIPRSADVVREGTGKLKWEADLDGAIYVYDRDQDSIRYTGPVRRGDEIIVQPNDDKVMVAGRIVSQEDLRRDDYHQLYFTTNANRSDRDRPSDNYRDDPRPRDVPGDDLPSGAVRLDRGDSVSISKAPRAGTALVYNEDAKKILNRTNLRKGAAFKVDASEGRLYVDGVAGSRVKIPRGHTLGLYFVDR